LERSLHHGFWPIRKSWGTFGEILGKFYGSLGDFLWIFKVDRFSIVLKKAHPVLLIIYDLFLSEFQTAMGFLP
jgi:hypothetical protein